MLGRQQLIEMRFRHQQPDCVWIDVDGQNTRNPASDWSDSYPAHAHLHADNEDRIRRLDMRCVHGLKCYIDGTDRARVHAMRDACIEVGASRVIAWVMKQLGEGEFVTFQTIEVFDTQDEFTFPKITDGIEHG